MFEDTTVDRRVLQMEFDNSKFDKNVEHSKKTFEDFKDTLNFDETSNGLARFFEETGVLAFEKLSDNIQALTDKFTGLGDAGEYVVSRIRNSFESAARYVESFVKSISIGQIDIGQSKYDALNKAVMTITADGKTTEQEAYNVFERLMTYTNETSYSFSDMVHQISAFNAAGQDLWASEKAMEGIANATAKAGQGTQQATAAMQVFAKAMGAGYLGRNQWDSLNLTAHMITQEFRKTLVETAAEVGTLQKIGDSYRVGEAYRSDAARNAKEDLAKAEAAAKQKKTSANLAKVENLQRKVAQYDEQMTVTIDNLESSLHNKWLTNEVLMKALQKYYFEGIDDPNADWSTFAGQAAKAAQRALSLADAINAIKEAVSAGWMTSFKLFWGDLSESMAFFTNVANRAIEILEKISDWRNRILGVWANEGGRVSFAKMIFGDYGEEIEEGAVGLLDLLEDLGDFISSAFHDFFKLFLSSEDKPYADEDGFMEAWFGGMLYNLTEGVRNFFKSIRDFFDEEINIGGETETRLTAIHEIVQGLVGAFQLGYQVVTGLMGFVAEIAAQLGPSFDSIVAFFAQLGASIYGSAEKAQDTKSISVFFHDLADTLAPLTSGINDFVAAFTGLLEVLLGVNEENGIATSIFTGIGTALTAVADTITRFGIPILQFFTSLFDLVGNLIQNGFSEESISAAGAAISNAFTTLINDILGNFENGGGVIGQAIRDLFGLDSSEEGEQSRSLFTFLHNVFVTAFDLFKQFTGGFFQGFNLSTLIKNGFGFGAARNFLSTVVGFFKNTNLYSVLMAFLGVASLFQFFRLITNIKKAVVGVRYFFEEIGDSLKSGFKVRFDDYGDYLLKMAQGIGIFVLCVVALGTLPLSGLIQGIVALGIVMGAVIAFNYFIKKTSEDMKVTDQLGLASQLVGLASVVIAISVGLSLLSLAILPLASDPLKMLTAVAGIVVMLGAVGLFIYLLMKGLTSLSQQVTMFQSKNSLFARSSNSLGKVALLMIALSVGILLISAGISLLMLAIVPLANSGWEALARGLLGLLGVLVLIGGFMMLMMQQAGKSKWNNIGKGATMMVGMAFSMALLAGALAILVVALMPLSMVSWEGFAKMFAGLAAMLVLLGGFLFAINKFADTTKSKTAKSGIFGSIMTEKESKELNARIKGLAGLAIGIGILVLALTPLSAMSWEGWGRSMLGLLAILTMLGAFIAVVKHFDLKNIQIVGLIGFTIGIALVVFSLKRLASLEWSQLAVGMTGLFGIFVLLAALMGMMKHFELGSVEITGIIVFAIGVWVLVQALLPLANLDLNQVIVGLVGLGGVLALVWGFVALINGMEVELKTVIGTFAILLGISLLMVVFSLALNEVKNVPWETIAAFSVGLSVMLIAMAGALLLVSNLSLGSSIKGILVLAVGIAAILGVITAMIPMILGAIGTGLADAGGKLSLAAGTISEFVDKLNGVSDGNVSHAESVINRLKVILESVAGVGGYSNSISYFTTALYDLGSGLVIFQSYISQINTGSTDDAISLIERLANSAAGLENVSKVNLSSFTAGLQGLGGALGVYAIGASEVSALKPGKTPDVGNAIYILEQLSQGLIDHGGFQIPSDLPDEEALGLFGAQLAALAMAMVKFETAGKDLGTGTEQALATLSFMTEIKTKLTKLNTIKSVVDFFSKDQVTPDVMEEFGKNIAQLGTSLSEFSKSTTTIDKATGKIVPLDFSAAITTLQSFADLKASLPYDAPTWLQWLTGVNGNLNSLGGEIENAGTALADFSTKAEQAVGTPEKATAIKTALAALSNISEFVKNLASEMPKIGGAKKKWDEAWNGRDQTIKDIASDISTLGPALAEFSTGLSTFTEKAESYTGTTDKTKAMTDGLNALETVYNFIRDLTDKCDKIGGIKNTWSSIWEGRKQDIQDIASDMLSLGPALAEFGTGLNTFTENASAAVGTAEKQKAMKDGLSAISIAMTFVRNLASKMPSIGGVKAKWDEAWNGRSETISEMATDIGTLGTNLGTFGENISSFVDNAGKSVGTQMKKAQMTAGLEAIEQVATFMTDLSNKLPLVGGIKGIWDEVWNGHKQDISDFSNDLKDLGESLGSFGDSISGKFQDKANTDNAVAAIEGFVGIMEAAAKLDEGYGLGPSVAVFSADLLDFVRYITNGMTPQEASKDGVDRVSIIGDMVTLMVDIGKKVKELGGVDGKAIQAFRDLAQALASFSQIDTKKNFENVGIAIADGVKLGIEKGTSRVSVAAQKMAVAAYNAAMEQLKAGSPSRVFEDVGSYVPWGFALGIENNTGTVVGAVDNMTGEAIETAGSLMSEIAKALAEDTDANPTITPVLDLTNVRQGVDFMNRNLTDGTMRINTQMPLSLASSIGRGMTVSENQNGTDYSGIYDRMTQLGERISEMNESIKRMKLVLDTGVVAGALTDEIDNNLGRQNYYSGRRN